MAPGTRPSCAWRGRGSPQVGAGQVCRPRLESTTRFSMFDRDKKGYSRFQLEPCFSELAPLLPGKRRAVFVKWKKRRMQVRWCWGGGGGKSAHNDISFFWTIHIIRHISSMGWFPGGACSMLFLGSKGACSRPILRLAGPL